MSTRAIYTFKDGNEEYHVYKHSDGYPTGAAEAINNALDFAWELPRFEADEFAAAFVAGNKGSFTEYKKRYGGNGHEVYRHLSGGHVRLLHSGSWQDVAPGDIQYRYEITKPSANAKEVHVAAFEVDQGSDDKWTEKKLHVGTLKTFTAWAKKKEAA